MIHSHSLERLSYQFVWNSLLQLWQQAVYYIKSSGMNHKWDQHLIKSAGNKVSSKTQVTIQRPTVTQYTWSRVCQEYSLFRLSMWRRMDMSSAGGTLGPSKHRNSLLPSHEERDGVAFARVGGSTPIRDLRVESGLAQPTRLLQLPCSQLVAGVLARVLPSDGVPLTSSGGCNRHAQI